MSDIPDNAPPPRLCHVTKWAHFEGYGFNLHADKSRPGQYIGTVDDGSPAQKAGLKKGDRIIEVNGVNIANENHKQVVQRIKAVDNETQLLVIDSDADKFYKTHNIVVNSSMTNVVRGSSAEKPATTPTPTPTNGHTEDDTRSVGSAASSSLHSLSSSHSQSGQEVETGGNKDSLGKTSIKSIPQHSPNPSLKKTPQPSPASSTKSSPKISHFGRKSPDNDSIKSDTNVSLKESLTSENIEHVSEKPENDKISENLELTDPPVEKMNGFEPDRISSPDPMENYDNVVFKEEEVKPGDLGSRKTSVSSSASSASSVSLHGQKNNNKNVQDIQSQMSTTPSPPPPSTQSPSPISNNRNSPSPNVSNKNTKNTGGLNLNMSVAEMKEQLRRKKRPDPRKDTSMDLKEKYKIIQSL